MDFLKALSTTLAAWPKSDRDKKGTLTYQAKILQDLIDAEIIQSTNLSDVGQKFIQRSLFTKLGLDIEVKVMLPIVDILNDVLGM